MALVTLAKVKSATYLDFSLSTWDTELQTLIDDVSQRAVQHMDRATAYTLTTVPADVSDAICTQVAFAWRHKDTPGQTSHQYEDGSSEINNDAFIPSVKQVIDLHREFNL